MAKLWSVQMSQSCFRTQQTEAGARGKAPEIVIRLACAFAILDHALELFSVVVRSRDTAARISLLDVADSCEEGSRTGLEEGSAGYREDVRNLTVLLEGNPDTASMMGPQKIEITLWMLQAAIQLWSHSNSTRNILEGSDEMRSGNDDTEAAKGTAGTTQASTISAFEAVGGVKSVFAALESGNYEGFISMTSLQNFLPQSVAGTRLKINDFISVMQAVDEFGLGHLFFFKSTNNSRPQYALQMHPALEPESASEEQNDLVTKSRRQIFPGIPGKDMPSLVCLIPKCTVLLSM